MPIGDKLTPRIIEMAKAGVWPKEIAEELGLKPHNVHCRMAYARKKGVSFPAFHEGRNAVTSRIVVDLPTIKSRRKLDHIATKMGIEAGELAAKIIDAAVQDGLVSAIIDA